MSSTELKMQCDVCKRTANNKLPFNCTFCARDALYKPRLQHAQILLQNERLERQIEEAVSGKSKSSKEPNAKKKNPRHPEWIIHTAENEQTFSEEKTQDILDHVQALREETRRMREDIAARKANLQRRRSDIQSTEQSFARSKAVAFQPFEKEMQNTNVRWDELHAETAKLRLSTCKDAAEVYYLQHHKRRKGSKGRDLYSICGVPIVDLRDLNNASPPALTASTTLLASLTLSVSHYLDLRLPAEITLPHPDYPYPTIFSPSSSYTTNRSIPFPGTTPSHSSSNSPSASRHHHGSQASQQLRPLPRPRSLSIEKPLSVLAKEDQLAYASFVEGITFLAWNIAWMCRTQGLPTGSANWEDLCSLGRNLYQLVHLTPSAAPKLVLPTAPSMHPQTSRPSTTASSTTTESQPPPPTPPPPPAHFSHNSAYAHLITAAGAEYMRSWRLYSAIKAVEKVKAMLLADRTGAEWEILEGDEWVEEEANAHANAHANKDALNGLPNVRITNQTRLDAVRQQIVNGRYPMINKIKSVPGIEETGILVQPPPALIDEEGRKKESSAAATKSIAAATVAALAAAAAAEPTAQGAGRGGRSGWMKLKSRSTPHQPASMATTNIASTTTTSTTTTTPSSSAAAATAAAGVGDDISATGNAPSTTNMK